MFGIDKRRSIELETIFQQTLPMLKRTRAEIVAVLVPSASPGMGAYALVGMAGTTAASNLP